MDTEQSQLRSDNFAYFASLVVALLMAAVSIAGIGANSYPTEALRQAFVPNDTVNLVLGLPILLGSMRSARRGQLAGRLFWPGALLFVLYTYLAYLLALPLSVWSLIYLLLVIMSLAATVALLTRSDTLAIQRRLSGVVPERLVGGVLAGLGALFLLRALGVIVSASNGSSVVLPADLAVSIADLVITPLWMIGGVLLWRHQPFGYAIGVGLLFQASLLFVGLILVLILQPLVSGAAFRLTDVVVIFVMGLICFIPFTIMLRGMLKAKISLKGS